MRAACGMHWACTVANPALSIISLLPTPQLRTAAFLAVLHTEVIRRSGKGVGAEQVVRSSELRHRGRMAVGHDRRPWRYDCFI